MFGSPMALSVPWSKRIRDSSSVRLLDCLLVTTLATLTVVVQW
jgi:hypothetical protein